MLAVETEMLDRHAGDHDALMSTMATNCLSPDDDDEPEAEDDDDVTSSTRLIPAHDAERRSPTLIRRRVTDVVGGPAAYRRHAEALVPPCRDPPSCSPSPTVRTTTQTAANDEQCGCCCCCCAYDVSTRAAAAPTVCHCRCPATRRFHFRSVGYHSDDDADEEDADNEDDAESVCSCCQCDDARDDSQHDDAAASQCAENQSLPVATTRLSSMTAMSLLTGRRLNDVCGRRRVALRSTVAKDTRSVVVSSSPVTQAGGPPSSNGLSSFLTFLRSGGRLWSSSSSSH